MEFKPAKSRSLSIKKGKSCIVEFTIGSKKFPAVFLDPVKSLGRIYVATLKDTKAIQCGCTGTSYF
jgi:hypothetical protein